MLHDFSSQSTSSFSTTRSLHNHLHGLVIIPLDLTIRDTAVALRGGNPSVAQEILDRYQLCIGIEHLSCHRMA